MRYPLGTILTVLLAVASCLCAAEPSTQPASAIRMRFLVVDNGGNKLVCVDQIDPAKGWSVAIPAGSRDMQLLDPNRVLVSHGNGAAEYATRDGAKLWAVDRLKGVSSARRLPNGNTLLISGAALIEVGPKGKELRRTEVKGVADPRLIRVTGSGSVLIALAGGHKVLDVDRDGKVVWEAALPGKGYVAERQADGSTIATVGAECLVVRLGKDGKVIETATLGGKDKHPRARLQWFSGMHLLPGGDVVVANWLGHGKTAAGPDVVRFSPDNKLVWQWEDHAAVKMATNVLVLAEKK